MECLAIYNCTADNGNQITFKKGDRIFHVAEVEGIEGWYVGNIHNKRGWLPMKYVKEVSPQGKRYVIPKKPKESPERATPVIKHSPEAGITKKKVTRKHRSLSSAGGATQPLIRQRKSSHEVEDMHKPRKLPQLARSQSQIVLPKSAQSELEEVAAIPLPDLPSNVKAGGADAAKRKTKKRAKRRSTITHSSSAGSGMSSTKQKRLSVRSNVASMISSGLNAQANTQANTPISRRKKKRAVKKKAQVLKKRVVTKKTVYLAKFDYEGGGEGTLAFKKGDVFLSCEEASAGWASATRETAPTQGWVPFAFVERNEIEDVKIVEYTEGEEPPVEVVLAPDPTRVGAVLVSIFTDGTSEPRILKMDYKNTLSDVASQVQTTIVSKTGEALKLYLMPAEDVRGENRFVGPAELPLQLSCFDLSEDSLLFIPEKRSYSVRYPNSNQSEQFIIKNETTPKELLGQIRNKHALYKDPEFKIFTSNDEELESTDSIWNQVLDDRTLKLRMPNRRISIFVKGGTQFSFEIDYSSQLINLLYDVCEKTGMEATEDLIFTQLGGQGLQLKMNKSLFEQRVHYPASLLLKSNSEEDIMKVIERKGEPVIVIESGRLWDEIEHGKGNIELDSEGKIVLASVNKLIEGLTKAEADNDFVQAFLLTFPSYITQLDLCRKLMERYDVPKKYESQKKQITLRVVIVMKSWIESTYSDLTHEVTNELVAFCDTKLESGGHGGVAKKIRSLMLERMCMMKSEPTKRIAISDYMPPPKVSKTKKYFSMFDYEEEEVARQLSLYMFELFSTVRFSEFLDCSWSKPKLKHKAPNLIAYIHHTNSLSKWVTSLILEPQRVKLRAKRFSQLIKIAGYMRAMNNFNGVMAFISGFHSAAIERLKFTKAHISNKNLATMRTLDELMDASGSFRRFREEIHNVNPPCLPYVGVYLTDLTFIEDGNPNEMRGLINFSKRRLLYRAIKEIQLFQQTGYAFFSVAHLRSILANIPKVDEKEVYELSLEREPRGAKKAKC